MKFSTKINSMTHTGIFAYVYISRCKSLCFTSLTARQQQRKKSQQTFIMQTRAYKIFDMVMCVLWCFLGCLHRTLQLMSIQERSRDGNLSNVSCYFFSRRDSFDIFHSNCPGTFLYLLHLRRDEMLTDFGTLCDCKRRWFVNSDELGLVRGSCGSKVNRRR